MCDWVEQAAFFLQPIRECIRREVLGSRYIQVDETPVRCNDPDNPNQGSRQGYLWVMSTPERDVVFEWHMSRKHAVAREMLEGYKGLLQTDGYEAYPAFAHGNNDVTWLACWAHARREFHEALATAPAQARFILVLIGKLYLNERSYTARGLGWGKVRADQRAGDNSLTLSLLKRTALRLREKSLPRSKIGAACGYLIAHWEPLLRTLEHGRARLDTNLTENSIRPTALGKRTGCSSATPTPATAPPSFTRSSSPANDAASIQPPTCATS